MGLLPFSQDPKDLDKHNYTKFYHMLQHEEDAFNAAAAAKPKATSEVKGAARQTSAIMVGKTEAHISLDVVAYPVLWSASRAHFNLSCPSLSYCRKSLGRPRQNGKRTWGFTRHGIAR